MVANAQSGHPGGSLSSLSFLSLLYTQRIVQTGETVIVSHGHISPAVYSVLAECGYIPKKEVINTFRRNNSIFEGHITRHVPGVWFGTGPLGVGVSASAGFAWSQKNSFLPNGQKKRVFALMGDGETQEGQVYEMAHFASKEHLSNLLLFVDANAVQLTGSIADTMPINIPAFFLSAGWNVLEVNGHSFEEMWDALQKSETENEKPTVIIGHTIMGYGVSLMEETGRHNKSDWHGKAPTKEFVEKICTEELLVSAEEETLLENFRKTKVLWTPETKEEKDIFLRGISEKIDIGDPFVYSAETFTDCRTAYGKALLDIAKRNSHVIASTADVGGSVMTKFVAEALPHQHIEYGIAEQNMVSVSGALSLTGLVPFCSTFGAFLSSRAKDQARVNDINECNTKMVATHCGLSVGEDGPTHQAIDDMGSFLGMFHTGILEPADPNHCDRIIRYISKTYGNFYVRMGRHKIPVLTKQNGDVFFGADYQYSLGRCDLLRSGTEITLIAMGATVHEAVKARENCKNPEKIEIIVASSLKEFDDTVKISIQKTHKVLTVEDHNTRSGLGACMARYILQNGIPVHTFKMRGVEHYELSGKPEELYKNAGIDAEGIQKILEKML